MSKVVMTQVRCQTGTFCGNYCEILAGRKNSKSGEPHLFKVFCMLYLFTNNNIPDI